jgi:hypothetical protein
MSVEQCHCVKGDDNTPRLVAEAPNANTVLSQAANGLTLDTYKQQYFDCGHQAL